MIFLCPKVAITLLVRYIKMLIQVPGFPDCIIFWII